MNLRTSFVMLLLRRFPLAADRRHDGSLFLKLGKSLIYLLTVGTKCLSDITGRDGLARLAHSL